MHGGGWVLGNAHTHDRLVRELAVGTGAAVVFVEYDRSPEAHYPVAIEQGYATARWIVREGAANELDPDRMAVAGDSVGGNMTAALAIMAQRARRRALRAPVDVLPGHRRRAWTPAPTSSSPRATSSPPRRWRGSGTPTRPTSSGARSRYASPLRASDEQLAGLPPAFVIVDEADVLRDEGEAYAARLRAAGVEVTTVRYDGITHDFMMLNPLSDTRATRAAVAQAIAILRRRSARSPDPHLELTTKELPIIEHRRPRPDTIVLIHGLWVTPRSWEHWIERYSAAATGARAGVPGPRGRGRGAARGSLADRER